MQELLQALHLLPVDLRQIRVQAGQDRGWGQQLGRQSNASCFQAVQLALQATGPEPVSQRVNDPVQLALDRRQLARDRLPASGCFGDATVPGGSEFLNPDRDMLGRHQAACEPFQNQFVERAALHAPRVGARALLARGGTGDVVAADIRHCAAAAAAKHLTGEEML